MPELCESKVDIRPQTRRVPADQVLAEFAARQHGVVAGRQLAAAGVTPSMVKTRLARAVLVPLHRGVYAVGHRRLRREGFWMAAVLAVGPDAVLSHRDAAALHDLRPANHERIDVTTPAERRSSRAIRVHGRRKLDPLDVTVVNGIPVTSVARTVVDLADVVGAQQLAKAVGEAERRRVFDLTAVEGALMRTQNRPGRGHAALRAVLDEHRHRGIQLTHSELEDRFVALIQTAGLPRPRMNMWIGDYEVDAVWPARRIAVELDGWAFHSNRRTFERDRVKANSLTARGWTVLRYTHDAVVRRSAEVAAELAGLLAP